MNLTGKSFSEALILATTNPQYDKRLFIDQAQNMLCTWIVLKVKTKTKKPIYVHTMFWACSFHARTGKSIHNNFLSYCGLVVARISASEKDLPVYEMDEVQCQSLN